MFGEGMIPPTVAISAEHIGEDLKVIEFELPAEKIIKIKAMASG